MKEEFIERTFTSASLDIIGKCEVILTEYDEQGYKLSLRQLYYQLVSRGFIENTIKSYKRTSSIVSDARLAGLLDWSMIEDRGREVQYASHWKNPGEILRSAAASFKLDRWKNQPCYVEVFVEKDALSGILMPVCEKMDVRFTANKGYSSSSAMYDASCRFVDASNEGKSIHIIYLGDHDPSGIDMSRDISDRFRLFTRDYMLIDLHRVALNFDQVQLWKPPENPAKESDSRYRDYSQKFGDKSWELDAVEPATLASLVTEDIKNLIEWRAWVDSIKQENKYIGELEKLSEKYL